MASNLRVDQILPSTSTNVAIGTATGSVTLVGSVSGTSITNSGVTTVAAGSTSAPSITPTGDSNTGIFFPSADTIAFAEGGTEALRINSSSNIGIGTTNPSRKLQVEGAGDTRFLIRDSSANIGYNISISHGSGASGNFAIGHEGVGPRLTIDSSGNTGIGITNPGRKFEIVGPHSSGNITTNLKISGDAWSLGGGIALEFGQDPANYPTWVTGRIASTYSGSNWGGGLKFSYNNGTTAATLTEGMELTRDGNLTLNNGNLVFSTSGKGIDFSATANAGGSPAGTTSSEVLSDYEEGTWTPYVATDASHSITHSVQVGKYTKIGNVVHFECVVSWSAFSGSGNVYLTNLPFTIRTASDPRSTAFPLIAGPSAVVNYQFRFDGGNANTTTVYLYNFTNTAFASIANVGSSGFFVVRGHYYTLL